MKPLLLSLSILIAFAAAAQEVKPVLSNDYLQRIRGTKDSTATTAPNDSMQMGSARLRLKPSLPSYSSSLFTVKRILVREGEVSLVPQITRSIFISGSYAFDMRLQSASRLLKLQNRFVQGGPQNGAPAWQGPETGIPYSFGPDVHTLEYDGSAYEYDVNGRLVPAGSGNGKAAQVYRNAIFKTGTELEQSLSVQARYLTNYTQKLLAKIRIGHSHEDLFIKDNHNNGYDLLSSLEANLNKYKISGTYHTTQTHFTRSNRTGIINRIYTDALLTPISFDNRQGTFIGGRERSFSPGFNNPYLLLGTGMAASQNAHDGVLLLQRKSHHLLLTLAPSAGLAQYTAPEGYPTAPVMRTQDDRNSMLKFDADINLNEGSFRQVIKAGYILSGEHTTINYTPGNHYEYRRTAQTASLRYEAHYKPWNSTELQARLGDKIQASTTSAPSGSFLPSAETSIHFSPGYYSHWRFRAAAACSRFNEEPRLGSSFAPLLLTQYRAGAPFDYRPFGEAAGYDGLSFIHHREHDFFLEINYSYQLTLTAEWFSRLVQNDVFPVLQNGTIVLKNVADHRNEGAELGIQFYEQKKDVKISTNLDFITSRNTVLKIRDGYKDLPTAGFNNVFLGIEEGKQLGVIIGSAYRRDTAGAVVIGRDGFPLVDAAQHVVGNPNPDFVVKLSQAFTWRKWSVQVNGEWSRGGRFWNGTQAVLDYYGRSQTSAEQRGVTDFVFAGVREDSHVNDQEVRFYDPSRPVTQNRWTRYGPGGVTEEYIQRADYIRLNTVGLTYEFRLKNYSSYVKLDLYMQNIILWTASSGMQPGRSLYDIPGAGGLNYFNLPSLRNFGFHTSLQF